MVKKQIEIAKTLIGQKADKYLKDGFEEYKGRTIVGYRQFNDAPNIFIDFDKNSGTDFISIVCFNCFDDCYIKNPNL